MTEQHVGHMGNQSRAYSNAITFSAKPIPAYPNFHSDLKPQQHHKLSRRTISTQTNITSTNMTALQPASDEMIPRSSGLAFRISNISRDITPDLFLESLQFLDNKPHVDGGGNLLGWSFAPSAASADAELYRTATVTFKSVPPQFQLPSNFVDLIPNAPPVIIDKDFYGLTPLYSPMQPTVEYVESHSIIDSKH